jgi:radical SAM superfamily enzyme YgiQ (UPF0313 family)
MSPLILFFHLPFAPPLFSPPAPNYLANYLNGKGIETEIMDINLDLFKQNRNLWLRFAGPDCACDVDAEFVSYIKGYFDRLTPVLLSKKTDWIGLSMFDSTFPFFSLFLPIIHECFPKSKIVLGGPDVYENYPLYQPLLESGEIHSVVIKEGEQKLLALLEGQSPLPRGVITQENSGEGLDSYKDENPIDLSETARLKTISNQNLFKQNNLIPVFASRGCSSNCSFCAHKVFWDGYRSKSPESMVEELNSYSELYGNTSFYFIDMLLNGSPKWLETFVDHLIENKKHYTWSTYLRVHPQLNAPFLQKMVKSGATFLSFGIESHSQSVLNHVRKGTTVGDNQRVIKEASDAGLFLHTSFIVGLPEESLMDMCKTLEFIKKNIWRMDHIEIFYFKNYSHSSGYQESQKYLDRMSETEEFQLIKDVHQTYLAPFNQVGHEFLSLDLLYSKNASMFKKLLCRTWDLFTQNNSSTLPHPEVLELFSGRPEILSLAKSMWAFKRKQISLLDQAMIRLSD